MKITEAYNLYRLQVIRDKGMKKSTEDNYRGAVKSLTTLVGDLDVEFLGLDHIIMWKEDMRDRGLQNTSINTNLSKLKQILVFLQDPQYEYAVRCLDPGRITRDKEVKKPKTIVTPEEMALLKNNAKNARDRAIISLYCGTGCRLSEILNLNRDEFESAQEVNPGTYEVWVCGKGDKYRPAYFTSKTKRDVEAYLETRQDHFRPLFMSNQNRRIGRNAVERMVHDVTRRAGLTKTVTPHTFRHSYASDLAVNNAPMVGISNLLGHANPAITARIYTHITDLQSQRVFANHHTDI